MADTRHDIQVLEWFDAVRRRPRMYVGETGHLGVLWLARGLLDVPLCPTDLDVTLVGRTLSVSAACVPPSIKPRTPGRPPFLVDACTTISLALDSPPTLAGLETIDESVRPATFKRIGVIPACLAIANALADAFTFASVSSGDCRRVEFARGVVVGPLASSPTAARDGLQFSWSPDPEIFGDASLQYPLLAEVAREIASVRGIRVALRDENSGGLFVAEAGAG